MTDARAADVVARLDAAEARLAAHAARPLPDGETEPSPGGEETWTAAQVWGHLSEFPAYWTAALRRIIAAPVGAPAGYGRTLGDPSRLAPLVEAGGISLDDRWAACRAGIAEARALIATLSGDDWDRVGVHVVKGPQTVGQIVEVTLAGHLEEHADQLDRLARG